MSLIHTTTTNTTITTTTTTYIMLQRIDLQSRLDEATENLLILEEHLSICQTRYEETMTIQNKHQQKMNVLMTKGLELKAALEDFGVAALSISREVGIEED